MIIKISKKKIIGILSVLFIILIYTYIGLKTFSEEHNAYYTKINNGLWVAADAICLDLVYSGELYQGQSTCAQGPVTYLTAALLKLIFQDKFFSIGLLITESFMVFVLAVISSSLVEYSLIALPLLLLVTLPLTYIQFSSALSCFFLGLAAYLIYRPSQNKYTLFFTGVLTSLALFSKATMLVLTIALIPTILFHCFLQKEITRRKEVFKVCIFLAGFIFTSSLILFLYPNSLTYSFLIQTQVNPASPLQVIHALNNSFITGTGVYHTLFIFFMTLFFAFFSFQYDKQLLPIAILMLAIIPTQISINTLSFKGQTLYFPIFDYHLFTYLVIFVLAFMLLYHKSRAWITLLLLLTVFWWVGYFTLPVILSQSDYLFMDVPHLINPAPKTVFHEFLNTLNYSHSFVDMGVARHINKPIYKINRVPNININFGQEDPEFGPAVKLSSLFNESKNQALVDYDKKNAEKIVNTVYKDIMTNNFDKIVVGGYPDSSILITLNYMKSQNLSNITDKICSLPVPLLFGSELVALNFLFFQNSDCEQMKDKMVDFFLPRLSAICNKHGTYITQTTAAILQQIGRMNQSNISVDCHQSSSRSSKIDPLGFLVCFLIIAGISFKKFKDVLRAEKPRRGLEYFFLALGLLSARVVIQLLIVLLFD